MLLKFFKRPLPLVLSSVIIIGILLWLKSFIAWDSSPAHFDSNQMPLYAFIHDLLKGKLFLYQLVGFLAMILCSLYLIQINSKHILIQNRTYLPALLFILFTSSQRGLHGLNPAVFSAIFLALTLNYIFNSYEVKKPFNNLFMAGFFVAIASLFYFPSAIYMILILVSVVIMRSFSFRSWLVSFFGFITPWYFVFLYYYLLHDNTSAIPSFIEAYWTGSKAMFPQGIIFYAFLAVSGSLLVVSLLHLIGSMGIKKISIRKFHSILLWFTIISGIIIAYAPLRSLEMIYIASIPISFHTSLFLSSSRNRFWPEFFIISLIIIVSLMQFL